MTTEKIIIYGVAAYLAFTVLNRKGVSLSGGVSVAGARPPTTRAQENAINAKTAMDLAYGIKGLFNSFAVENPARPTAVIEADELYSTGDSDFWAANPPDPY